jgi:predicted lipase
VHEGFFASLNSSTLYTQLQFHLAELLQEQPVARVYFLGHSLGGAMAAIAAPLMKAQLNLEDVRLWTFGCPRVGNQVRASWRQACVLVHAQNTGMSPDAIWLRSQWS